MSKRYRRNIIFSKAALNGGFRFDDQFQIYPLGFEGAPNFDKADDLPLIIEYWVDENEEIEVSEQYESIKKVIELTSIQERKLNQLTRLLSVLTNHRLFNAKYEGIKWGISFPSEQSPLPKERESLSQLFIPVYCYPNMASDLNITSFSEHEFEQLKLVDYKKYYIYDPIEGKRKEITFPSTINDLLASYFSLEAKTKSKVDTICHLVSNGLELEKNMKSLSFLSFVSAIEILVALDYRSNETREEIAFNCKTCQSIKSSPISCDDCGRPAWGISAKFRMFLEKYVATSGEAKRKFSRIYGLRSKIVHEGSLFLGDENFDWSESDKSNSEWMIYQETKQLARIAISNWLYQKRPTK